MIRVKAKKYLDSSSGPIRLGVDFEVSDQEFVTLFGPSGAGKTTLARHVALATPNVVAWCDLAAEQDGHGVVLAVARALGIALEDVRQADDRLQRAPEFVHDARHQPA